MSLEILQTFTFRKGRPKGRQVLMYSSPPLLCRLNGGPTCSSMIAWGQENGPFNLNLQYKGSNTSTVTGVSLTANPNAWNSVANMLYIDNPVGTGLSYSDSSNDYHADDEQTSTDLFAAVQQFFTMWPEMQPKNFYISGEVHLALHCLAKRHTSWWHSICASLTRASCLGSGGTLSAVTAGKLPS